MMNIQEYFESILETEGYDAWNAANAELVALVEQEEAAWLNDEELDLTTAWAEAHGVDLTLGYTHGGCFFTYYQHWYWDNFED